MIKIVSIGVYGYTPETFFAALQDAGVQLLCDVRWRRGVRGAEYTFANHQRLVARLESLGIAYCHRRDLAPPPEMRQQQYQADRSQRVTKRQRQRLSAEFMAAYRDSILAAFDPGAFLEELPPDTRVVALLCVERQPAACHRSLLAEKLEEIQGIIVEHLLPDPA
jgi:uncharacterized protein (DUF488 family)